MITVDKVYPYSYFLADFPDTEFTTVPEDVYFEHKGMTYSQFYKGQLIPVDVYNEIFGKEKQKEIEEIRPTVDPKTEEVVEEKEAEVVEKKPKQKRHKSIIKK